MIRRLCLPVVSAAVLTGTARALVWATAEPLHAVGRGDAGLDQVVGLTAALAAWVVLAWLGAALACAALATASGALGRFAGSVAARMTPVGARHLVRLAVGLTVAAGPVTACASPPEAHLASGHSIIIGELVDPSQLPSVGRPGPPIPPATTQPATPAPSRQPLWPSSGVTAELSGSGTGPPHPDGGSSAVSGPDGGRMTERAGGVGAAGLAAGLPEPVRESDAAGAVVVKRGDTLWAIAARHLGPSTTAAQIAAEWPRWHAANRAVIGADPDLILPGMILHPPGER